MKTPKQMLEEIAGEMTDAQISLEFLYQNTNSSAEVESIVLCTIRSLIYTNNKAQRYIEELGGEST
ncbi:hypothetical protein SB6413_02247 [Klebsiella pasteurii]|uniref:hypothetical protein n=1 Tax=Klebsiella pasteurii TaxID=2587529 RepID=UPI00115EA3E6|nr:hypothetical protein [Klebsiella pasteurii]VUT17392.1 hypothetical protein SB6413_02247 [Klebsiella pasteurii]